MTVVENICVRKLRLYLSDRERVAYHEAAMRLTLRGVHFQTVVQGPKRARSGDIIVGRFDYTTLIDERNADEFLKEINKGDTA